MLEQLPTLLAASHWALVSRTLALHVGVALEKGYASPNPNPNSLTLTLTAVP